MHMLVFVLVCGVYVHILVAIGLTSFSFVPEISGMISCTICQRYTEECVYVWSAKCDRTKSGLRILKVWVGAYSRYIALLHNVC